MKEVLSNQHDPSIFQEMIDRDISIICCSCFRCGFQNPKKLIPSKGLSDFMKGWHEKISEKNDKIKVRTMLPKKTEKGWTMFCDACFKINERTSS